MIFAKKYQNNPAYIFGDYVGFEFSLFVFASIVYYIFYKTHPFPFSYVPYIVSVLIIAIVLRFFVRRKK